MSKKVFATDLKSEIVQTKNRRIEVIPNLNSLNLSKEGQASVTELINLAKKSKIRAGKTGVQRLDNCVLFSGINSEKLSTAGYISKTTNSNLFRIDLGQVVKEFIGETEKNLSGLFDRAESNNWILFFDEADALFGKRTNVKDSHDRFANELTAFLLERIERYDGFVIISSNNKEGMDNELISQFRFVIDFPNSKPRIPIWLKFFNIFRTRSKRIITISEME